MSRGSKWDEVICYLVSPIADLALIGHRELENLHEYRELHLHFAWARKNGKSSEKLVTNDECAAAATMGKSKSVSRSCGCIIRPKVV